MTDQPEMTAAEKIRAWMEAHGVSVESTFVPYSKSRNAKGGGMGGDKPWPSLNWSVRILAPKGRMILETSYSAGSAHAPAYKASAEKIKRAAMFYGRSDQVTRADMIAWELENGKAVASVGGGQFSGREPITPDPVAVLASLAMDSSVLDAGGFEAWAAEFDYDPDSRKAEAIYRACLEIALKLRAGLGEAGLSALREVCQDY